MRAADKRPPRGEQTADYGYDWGYEFKEAPDLEDLGVALRSRERDFGFVGVLEKDGRFVILTGVAAAIIISRNVLAA